ncbi:hypothetical protein ACOMHN_042500 [Nucella lapillus]
MEILYSKIISGAIIFVLTLLCGCGPFLLLRRYTDTGPRHRNRTASRINSTQAFACGIFIGTCLLHLLPEAAEDIKESLTSALPLSEMLVAFGFLLLLVMENLILACHDRGNGGEREQTVTVVSVEESRVNDNSCSQERRGLMDGSAPSGVSYGSMTDGQNGSGFHRDGEQYSNIHADKNQHACFSQNETQAEGSHHSTDKADRDRRGSETKSDKAKRDVKSEERSEQKEVENKKAVLKSFVLLFALSLHTVFDGLVVGLQSKQTEVWTLLAAVGLHKVLIAISIALSLLESHYNYPAASLFYLFLFSLVAPAGLAVGVILTETDFDTHAQTLTSGVLQSVATGTFMYVTFVESLKGRFDGRDRLLNVFLVLIGFGLVCGLRIVLPG